MSDLYARARWFVVAGLTDWRYFRVLSVLLLLAELALGVVVIAVLPGACARGALHNARAPALGRVGVTLSCGGGNTGVTVSCGGDAGVVVIVLCCQHIGGAASGFFPCTFALSTVVISSCKYGC